MVFNNRCLIIHTILSVILTIGTMQVDCVLTKQTSAHATRSKRGAQFPINSATGILVAIAVPLDIPKRNIFVSYNFEANYNMPTTPREVVPGPLTRLDLVRSQSREQKHRVDDDDNESVEEPRNNQNDAENVDVNSSEVTTTELPDETTQFDGTQSDETTEELATTTALQSDEIDDNDDNDGITNRDKREEIRYPLVTRRQTYRILESKLDGHGFEGKACLLRAICEAAETPLNHHNGVLGDIVHIILTPSSSKDEGLHQEYYKAEVTGRISSDCRRYRKYCPESALDLITTVWRM